MAGRIQLSSDAMNAYRDAVDMAFGPEVNYGQIVKTYASPSEADVRKYSPPAVTAVRRTTLVGMPNVDEICASQIERANLTARTHCKRLARLTLSFSKKLENFKAAIGLHMAYYNTARHVESVAVREVFNKLTAWEGVVEVYDTTGHPRAKRCYAWTTEDRGQLKTTAVVEIPTVDSPHTAVKIAIAAAAKSNKGSS